MIDYLETGKAIWRVAGPIAGGAGVWAYMRARVKAYAPRHSSPSQITESQADLVTAVNNQTKTVLDEAARLRRESNREMRALKKSVERISIEVAECNGRHEECEGRVAGLTQELAEIANMMKVPVEDYTQIRRVGDKDR